LARPAGLGTVRDERSRVATLPEDGGAPLLAKRGTRPAGLERATPGLEEAPDPVPHLVREENATVFEQIQAPSTGRGPPIHYEGCGNIRVLGSIQSVPAMRALAVTLVDRERFARARQRGEHAARSGRAVVAVHYDEQRDAIELLLQMTERSRSSARIFRHSAGLKWRRSPTWLSALKAIRSRGERSTSTST
jgi:hypothetical protein